MLAPASTPLTLILPSLVIPSVTLIPVSAFNTAVGASGGVMSGGITVDPLLSTGVVTKSAASLPAASWIATSSSLVVLSL